MELIILMKLDGLSCVKQAYFSLSSVFFSNDAIRFMILFVESGLHSKQECPQYYYYTLGTSLNILVVVDI